MSLSDFPYPGNASARPRVLRCGIPQVALWWCELDDAAPTPANAEWLSPRERARAERFHSDALARRYVGGRAALRWILGQRLGIAPGSVPIERGERGRPRLTGPHELDFNVSNTRNRALVGIVATPGARIGVDLEHAERVLNHVGLARKFLTPREQLAIASCEDDEHRRAFLRLWTCKEAMSKATGDALSAPLRKLDVKLVPVLRLVDGPPPYVPQDWRLLDVDVPDGYLGTVALWDSRSNPAAPA